MAFFRYFLAKSCLIAEMRWAPRYTIDPLSTSPDYFHQSNRGIAP